MHREFNANLTRRFRAPRDIPDGAVVVPGEYLEVVVPSSAQKFHASLPFTAWSSTALANRPR